MVVAEALSYGVPVLCTEGSPWSELNTASCGWYVPHADESIQQVLLEVFKKNSNDLFQMGLNGQMLIQRKYTWNLAAKKMAEAYKWLLNQEQKPDFFYD